MFNVHHWNCAQSVSLLASLWFAHTWNKYIHIFDEYPYNSICWRARALKRLNSIVDIFRCLLCLCVSAENLTIYPTVDQLHKSYIIHRPHHFPHTKYRDCVCVCVCCCFFSTGVFITIHSHPHFHQAESKCTCHGGVAIGYNWKMYISYIFVMLFGWPVFSMFFSLLLHLNRLLILSPPSLLDFRIVLPNALDYCWRGWLRQNRDKRTLEKEKRKTKMKIRKIIHF